MVYLLIPLELESDSIAWEFGMAELSSGMSHDCDLFRGPELVSLRRMNKSLT
jgi:hypothetical protein